MKVHFREQFGTKGNEVIYVTPAGNFGLLIFFSSFVQNKICISDQQSIVCVPLKNEKIIAKGNNSLINLFQRIFLPQGYPNSVSEDYIDYQKWDTVQAFCSTISGTLTTHAILKGVGVGSDIANPLSATITWILKDGTGHFGKILFAWWKGTELDFDSKKWRIRADVLNDIAMGIELFLLPKFPLYSTFILCGTSTMKAIVGVTGGATRSALTQHHALRGNLADVSSKDSAQETFVNLIASFVGLFLLTGIKNQTLLYTLFVIVTLLHIYANIKAVKSICLKSFNESRYLIALEEFFKSGRMLSPKEVNQLERVTIGQTVSLSIKIKIGLSASNLLAHYKTSNDIENIVSCFDAQEKFLIAETKKCLGIYLNSEARSQDVLKAYFYAVSYLQDRTQIRDRYWEIQNKWNEFLNLSQNEGWNISSHLLFVDEYRLEWRI